MAWLICKGIKDVENRDWRVPSLQIFSLPKRIYVHAGIKFDDTGWDFIRTRVSDEIWQKVYYGDLSSGAIVGEVDIVDCVTESKSPWFIGEYGFVLANPTLYEKPILYKGKLGFFEVEFPL